MPIHEPGDNFVSIPHCDHLHRCHSQRPRRDSTQAPEPRGSRAHGQEWAGFLPCTGSRACALPTAPTEHKMHNRKRPPGRGVGAQAGHLTPRKLWGPRTVAGTEPAVTRSVVPRMDQDGVWRADATAKGWEAGTKPSGTPAPARPGLGEADAQAPHLQCEVRFSTQKVKPRSAHSTGRPWGPSWPRRPPTGHGPHHPRPLHLLPASCLS